MAKGIQQEYTVPTSKNYQQYKDTTPLKVYSNLDHLNLKRKQNYYKRFGKKDNAKFESAKYFSNNYLW